MALSRTCAPRSRAQEPDQENTGRLEMDEKDDEVRVKTELAAADKDCSNQGVKLLEDWPSSCW
jgi:hypothetical protein